MKNIAVLGSTGSIGTQTLEIIKAYPDRFSLVAMAAGTNIALILEQVHQFKPKIVSVGSKEIAEQLKEKIPNGIQLTYGIEGLHEVATYPNVDFVLTAVVGSIGIKPTIAAIEAGKTIAIANKETLVSAGQIVMEKVKQHQVSLLPVDSEHSAIFQCLQGEDRKKVEEIILTASGGSFRHKTREELQQVTVNEALKHPNWSMGAKVTIDSATMMNKGLEVIEACWLFKLPFEKIKVILHEESIIHSMVSFEDSAIMAQLGNPDMKVPIQYALTYPERVYLDSKRLQLEEIGQLHFKKMDFNRYPCLQMAYDAGQAGGTMPTVLNAANEIAVAHFLDGRITFLDIEEVIQRTMDKHELLLVTDLEVVEEADRWARDMAVSISQDFSLRK